MQKLKYFLQHVCTHHSKSLITPHFNLPTECYNSRQNGIPGNEHDFVKLLNHLFLHQINTNPTSAEQNLHLLITSIPHPIKISQVLKPSHTQISTNHSAIIFHLPLSRNPIPKINRTVFHYHPPHFHTLSPHLHSLNLTQLISKDADINQD